MSRALTALKWFGTAAQVVGVFLLAGRLIEPWAAYIVMLAGSAAWTLAALQMREWSMMALNAAFTVSNVIGIWRWLSP